MGRTVMLAAAAGVAMGLAGAAEAAVFAIEWKGNGGYLLEGLLQFDDGLLDTGVIDETQIQNLQFTVYLDGVSQGDHNLSGEGLGAYAADFNLNFDTTARRFLVGGDRLDPDGQNWLFSTTVDPLCDPVGFFSGVVSQGVCVGGAIQPTAFVELGDLADSPLKAFRLAEPLLPVPLPAAGGLLAAALAGLGLLAQRRG